MEQNIESKHSIIAEYYTECYAELKGFVASRLLGDEKAEQAEVQELEGRTAAGTEVH